MSKKEARVVNLIEKRIIKLNIYRESIGNEPHIVSEIKFLDLIEKILKENEDG